MHMQAPAGAAHFQHMQRGAPSTAFAVPDDAHSPEQLAHAHAHAQRRPSEPLARDRKRSSEVRVAPPQQQSNGHAQEEDKGEGGSSVTMFQCRGFGDCKMVFTRSEHLARHVR